MGWIDVVEGLKELMPRHWKRWVSLAIVAAFLAFPTQAQRAVLWYGQEKGRQISETIAPLLVPPATPSPTPTAS